MEPDFTLFENPQKGYSVFEGIDLAEVAKTMRHPSEAKAPAQGLPPLSQEATLDPMPPSPSLPQSPTSTVTLRTKLRPGKQATQPTDFVFKKDWDLLLSHQQFKVLEYLASFNTPEIWIQATTIEKATHVSIPTIKRTLAVLQSKKFIKNRKVKVTGGDRHRVITLSLSLCQKAITANRKRFL